MSAGTAAGHVVQVLGEVPAFQGLHRADLERIAELATPRSLMAGEFLFREGDPGQRFYLLEDGAVEVLRERPLGDHERLAVHRGGEAFGELSLIKDSPRTVSVRAVEDTRLLAFDGADFLRLLGGDSLAVRLLRGMALAPRSRNVRFAPRNDGGGATFLEFGHRVLDGLEPAAAPRAEGYRIAGATARDEAVGAGSLWDAFSTDDGRTILALTDVRGAGLPPAYLIAITRALLHEVAPEEPFDTLLRRLNAATFHNLFDGLDECVEAALVEIRDGRLRWASAGDQAAVILRRDGTIENARTHGPPLGILPHFDYQSEEIHLESGDILLASSTAPAALLKGAVELARGRLDADPTELARILQVAFRKIQSRGAETDLSFLVVKKT
jgi:sigma-B regulation protein RsbU (phosphoserine phosphatase)